MAGRFSIEAIFKATDRFTRPIAKMESRLDRFARRGLRGLSAMDKYASKLSSGMKTLGSALAAAAVPAGLLAYNIGKTGADFEQAITNVGAVGLQTRDQIASLEKKALDLGATTQFTATQAAEAMEIMARAGFKNEEILSGVGGVLDAAAASGLEMAEVANHVSNVLKGMGLQATDAARVADVLALASSRTNSSIGSLGESMKNLAPVARQLNVPLEQAVASVALLQDVGLDASEAGTATATMLTKLTKPIPEVAKRMKQLGIAFKDSAGNALPLPQILGQFDKAAKKSGGNMEVVAFFADLVGLRGQKAALNLKDMFTSGKLSTLVDELEKAEGSAKKMAALRLDSFQGDLTLLGSAVDAVKIKLYNLEASPLRDVAKAITSWVSENQEGIVSGANNALSGLKEFGSLVAKSFNDALKPAKEALSGIFDSWGSDDTEFVKGMLVSFAQNLGKIAAFGLMAAGAFTVLAGGVFAAGNAIVTGLFAVLDDGIALIGDSILAFDNWWAKVKAYFGELPGRMRDFGRDVVRGLVDGIKSLADAPLDAIKSVGTGALNAFKEAMGIRSPSVEMSKLGKLSAMGLERGILSGVPGITKATAAMYDAVGSLNIGGRFADNDDAERSPASVFVVSQKPELSSSVSTRNESVSKEQVEVVIKDERGGVELRRSRRGQSGLRLVHSGADY